MGEKAELVTRGGLVVPASAVAVERRDPRAATRPLQFISPGRAMVPEWDADAAFRLGYIANVVAYRCVQIVANDVASVPLRAGRKYRDRNTLNESAAIVRRLGPPPGGPAPKLSARKLLRWTVAQQLVAGRRAWEIETNDAGVPVAFWPLVAARLDAIPSRQGINWFQRFEYQSARFVAEPVTLKPEQVFYGWDPAGLDFRQAESALQAARFDLSLAMAADRYSISFLRNNAVPAAVVTTALFADDNQRQAFRRQWNSEYAGWDNAGRTLFNEAGDDGDGPVGDAIDVKVLGLSQKDARLAEMRKDALMEVAISLGVPWSKLDASGRTFDNAEAEDRTYWEERVLPLLLDLEDDINMQLAPRMGDDVAWFDLDEVRVLRQRAKPTTQTVGAPALVQAQLMTVNEARADYGLPGLPDGDRVMTVEEIAALKGVMGGGEDVVRSLLEALEARSPEPGGEDRGAGDAGDREAPGGSSGTSHPSPAPEARAVDPEAIELRRARIWRTADATVRALEGRWERAWKRLFARQAKAALARLNGKRGRQLLRQGADGDVRQGADEVFDRAFWLAETIEEAGGLLEGVVEAGFVRIATLFGVTFDLEAEWAQDFIRARANQLAGQVTDTTYAAVQEALAEGVDAGESIPDLAERLQHVFDVADTKRATVIARTEVVSAFNGSAHLTAAQLPGDVVGGQEWIATRDGRVRPEHAAADGQVVAMDAAFSVGGEALAYPGDPAGSADNTVQCRCTVAFLTPTEVLERAGRSEVRTIDARRALRWIQLAHEQTDWLAYRQLIDEEAVA